VKTNTFARVLVVDDSTPLAERVEGLLEGTGAAEIVAHATDAASAQSLFAALRPDAVVLDIQLPDGSGIELAREFKRQAPGVLIIMLTNHAGGAYRYACALAGADHFFDKSTEFESVAELFRLRYRSSLEAGPS
jgi:DNA-binding NarL/FixJ family response regulator